MGENREDINELLDRIFANVNNWLTFAEAKNGALIALNIGMIAAIIGSLDFWGETILTYIVIICIMASTVVSLFSFIPQTGKDRQVLVVHKAEDNLLFYQDIAKYSASEYLCALYKKYYNMEVQKENLDKLELDYSREITYNAFITDNKNIKFRKALEIDLLTFLIIGLMLVIA